MQVDQHGTADGTGRTVQEWALSQGKWVVMKPRPKVSSHIDDQDALGEHSEDDQVAESPGKPAGRKRIPTETLAEVR